MKSLLIGLALAGGIIATPARAAPSLAGHWQGTLVEQGRKLAVSFDFDADQAHGRFTSESQAAMDYPLDAVKREGDQVGFTLGGGMSFAGRLQDDVLSGEFKGGDGAGSFLLSRAAPAALPYAVLPVTFHDGAVTLHGSLCLPRGPGRHPAVVLVHGSGPQTRWGTPRYLADRLARRGVAALIYDKRGSGESSGDWTTSSYADLARDALAGVALLDARPDIDARRIGIMGHSQGGVVGPLAASLAPGKTAFIVAEDTFAGVQHDQDVYRVAQAIKGLGLAPADEATAMRIYALFVDAARGAIPYETFAKAAAPYTSADWYAWMAFPSKDSWVWTFGRLNGDYDSMLAWRQVRVPVLLVYGEKDTLEPVSETIARIEAALDASGAPYAAFVAPGAVHNLTIQPQPGQPFFWWRQAPGVTETVVDWIARQPGLPPTTPPARAPGGA